MLEFENLVPRQITINGSANKGFIVKCGCCVCVFTDKKEMVNAILDYINDPDKIEKAYNDSQKTPRGYEMTGVMDDCIEAPEAVTTGRGFGTIARNACAEVDIDSGGNTRR